MYDVITHAPLFRRGGDYVCVSPWGHSSWLIYINSPFIQCVASQFVFKPRDVIMLLRAVAIAPSAMLSPWRVPLNGMFHNDSATHWCKMRIKKKKIQVTFFYQIRQTRAISIPFIHSMGVIKAMSYGCVQNDSETHYTGVTGLHPRLRHSCKSSNAVLYISLSFRTHPGVLAIESYCYWHCWQQYCCLKVRNNCKSWLYV